MPSSSTTITRRRPALRFLGGLIAVVIVVGLGLGLATMISPSLRTVMAEAAQAKPTPAPIDADRAYGYLKTICKIGPRPAGSAANTRQRQMVAEHFRKNGGTVREQPFRASDPLTNAPVDMVNLVGSWFPDRTERVLLAAHYDTRPFPDEDKDPAKRKDVFIGANDGASGVALLMEIAHHLADSPTPWGVDLVLFDGEELVYGGGNDQVGPYFLGSKAFARAYVEEKGRKHEYVAAIVLDMVGGKNLAIDQEPYSLDIAGNLVRDVWAVARALKVKEFRDQVGRAVYDDHLALQNAGIPAIDLIDFDPKGDAIRHWHTASDLPEHCSGASLAKVGKVVTGWLNKPKPRPRAQ